MKMWLLTLATCLACAVISPAAWHNGGDKTDQPPKFGTHDYIAFKGYQRVPPAKVTWIKQNLEAYFIGTEAPDTNKKIPGVTEGGYHDSLQCHCVLFDQRGVVTTQRAMLRTRQEFDRAVAALHAGQRARAAFFAGAMAHYVGDLSQFCHVMGAGSHWGAEDQKLHAAYENAVDRTIDFRTRTSSLLDGYLATVTVGGDKPEDIAEAVARFDEDGAGRTQRPGWMIDRLTKMKAQGTIGKVDKWGPAFRDRTGINVNHSINAVEKLLTLVVNAAS
jgi:Zinc dependent phospholipase C